jgi:hypothetical protein
MAPRCHSASTLRPYCNGFPCLVSAGGSGDKLKVHWIYASTASPTGDSSGPSTLILMLGGIAGRIHCRGRIPCLGAALVGGSNAAFGSRKAPKLAEAIDLPQIFESGFQFAAKQRAQLVLQREVPDDIAGRVGEDVFESLVENEMISDFRLPCTWTFRPYDSPDANAFSLAAGLPTRPPRTLRKVIFISNHFDVKPHASHWIYRVCTLPAEVSPDSGGVKCRVRGQRNFAISPGILRRRNP